MRSKRALNSPPTGLITTFALRIEPFRPSVAPIVSIILVLRVLVGDKAKSSMAAIFESDLVVFDLRGNGKVWYVSDCFRRIVGNDFRRRSLTVLVSVGSSFFTGVHSKSAMTKTSSISMNFERTFLMGRVTTFFGSISIFRILLNAASWHERGLGATSLAICVCWKFGSFFLKWIFALYKCRLIDLRGFSFLSMWLLLYCFTILYFANVCEYHIWEDGGGMMMMIGGRSGPTRREWWGGVCILGGVWF